MDPLFLLHVNSLNLVWQRHDIDEVIVMDMLLYVTGSMWFMKPYVLLSYLNSLIAQMQC